VKKKYPNYPRHPLYSIWQLMLTRCRNPNHPYFRVYGGRGITVCARWHDFKLFLEDMGPRPPGHSIDRIDNDGNYEPGNCRWATPLQQSRNSSWNRMVTYNGETKCAAEWAEALNLPYKTLTARLRAGWSAERALLEPVNKPRRKEMNEPRV
jgi:hypothetical protein